MLLSIVNLVEFLMMHSIAVLFLSFFSIKENFVVIMYQVVNC